MLGNAKGTTIDELWLFSQKTLQNTPKLGDPLRSRDPYNLVFDDGVAVNEYIATTNNPVQVNDLGRGILIPLSNRYESLADNFQLSFNA